MFRLLPLLLLTASLVAHAQGGTITVTAINADMARANADSLRKPGEPLQLSLGQALSTQDTRSALPAAGQWQLDAQGMANWSLDIHAPGALTVELLLSEMHLPEGAELSLSGSGQQTPVHWTRDTIPDASVMLTPLVFGEVARLRLSLPDSQREAARLSIESVLSGFRDPRISSQMGSGACNVDSVCPQADAWRDQIQSVAHFRFVRGAASFACTGQLIANSAGTQRALFLTAHHCLSSESAVNTMTFYWNYASPECRAIGSPSNADGLPLSIASHIQSGATLLATYVDSDFTLVELDQPVPSGAHPFWSGWDRRDLEFNEGGVSIHHPQGDAKRISFASSPVLASRYLGNPGSGDSHLRLERWDLGTTEGGSSGSGLWSQDQHLIGQLHGGRAACGNSLPDWYGRLAVSWDGGGSADSRLRDHLDPLDSEVEVLDGYGLCDAPRVTLSQRGQSRAGELVTFAASVSGGVPPYSLSWDLDGDGFSDREDQHLLQIQTRYAQRFQGTVEVEVRDADGCLGSASLDLQIEAPELRLFAVEAPTAVCGNAGLHPGGEYRLRVRLRNLGVASEHLMAMFAASDPRLDEDTTHLSALGVIANSGVSTRSNAVRLQTPVVELGAVDTAGVHELELRFRVDAAAQCGAPLEIDFLGSVEDGFEGGDAGGAAPRRDAVLRTTVDENCSVQRRCLPASEVQFAAAGHFFDPDRPGNGLSSQLIRPPQGEPVYFGNWLTGDQRRLPTWYIIQGPWRDAQLHAPILRFSRDEGASTASAESVGEAWLAQLDEQRVVLRWRLGDDAGIELLRAAFPPLPSAIPDYSGTWFNPAQADWGVSVHSYLDHGNARDLLFPQIYDVAGQPRWLFMDQVRDDNSGTVRVRRVHCPGCPWLAIDDDADQDAGSLKLQFKSTTEGSLDSDIFLPSPLSGSWQRQSLPLQPLTQSERP